MTQADGILLLLHKKLSFDIQLWVVIYLTLLCWLQVAVSIMLWSGVRPSVCLSLLLTLLKYAAHFSNLNRDYY